jgi:hypothetical protein
MSTPAAAAEGVRALAPEPDPVPELLEQLVTRHDIRCVVCAETITRFEMFTVWPLAGVVAHLSCYAGGRRLGGES